MRASKGKMKKTKAADRKGRAGSRALRAWNVSNERLRDTLHSLCFLGPSLLGVMVFFIVPFLVVVFYSVIRSPINPEFVGLDNFIAVLKNSSFQTAAKNTAMFSIIAVPLAVVLSLGLALILECRIPCKSLFRTFFLSPMMVPVASVVLIWQVVFHYNGTLNVILSHFGVDPIDWLNSPYCLLVIVVLFLWKNLGYNMILFMAALNNIPKELLEVADVEGASAAHKFFNIKLRYLSPTVLFVTILSIINSFKVFREIYLLTGDYPHEGLYLLQHYLLHAFRRLQYGKLAAVSLAVTLALAAVTGLFFRLSSARGKDVDA